MARIGARGALVLLILCAAPAAAQTAGNAQGATRVVRHQAPADRAFDFPAAALQAEFGEMAQKNDVVFIPPGVPHGIRDTTGIAYLNIHFGGTD